MIWRAMAHFCGLRVQTIAINLDQRMHKRRNRVGRRLSFCGKIAGAFDLVQTINALQQIYSLDGP
jgi:hypothetical protein